MITTVLATTPHFEDKMLENFKPNVVIFCSAAHGRLCILRQLYLAILGDGELSDKVYLHFACYLFEIIYNFL